MFYETAVPVRTYIRTPGKYVVSIPTKRLVFKSSPMPVTMSCQNLSSVVPALINSGAEGSFIHTRLVEQLQIPVMPLKVPLSIAALDGKHVGQ